MNTQSLVSRTFLARWLGGSLLVVGLVTSFTLLHHFFAAKFGRTTGEAEWIWHDHALSSGEPLAMFLAHEFDVPPNARYVKLKVVGDPEYIVYFNGVEIGGGQPARFNVIDVYEVTDLARPKRNRVLASLRSGNGVGGFLLSVDFSPTYENVIVSDDSWQLYRSWSPQLLDRDIPSMREKPPRAFGMPPIGKWDFLDERARPRYAKLSRIVTPRRVWAQRMFLPNFEVISGVSVSKPISSRALIYDFGRVLGRVRIEVPEAARERVIKVRFVGEGGDPASPVTPGSIVVARGETTVTSAEETIFRYFVVYDSELRPVALVR